MISMILKEIRTRHLIIGLNIDIKITFELKALKKLQQVKGHSDSPPLFLSKNQEIKL